MADKDGASRNLYQRLQRVADKVGEIMPTGHNQYKAAAVSVEDVENAIRPYLVEEGIITRWSYTSLEQLPDGKLWRANIRVTVVNVDNPDDCFHDDWSDIGMNPMAATSFAVKGYYKRLFHVAEASDEAEPRQQRDGGKAQSKQRYSDEQIQQARESSPEAASRVDRIRQEVAEEVAHSGGNGSQGAAPVALLRVKVAELAGLIGLDNAEIVNQVKAQTSVDLRAQNEPAARMKALDWLEGQIAMQTLARESQRA